MAHNTLTDIAIRKLAPRSDRFEVFDAKIPGFAVRVAASGVKSFVVLYRVKGRLRRMTLGRYPTVSLADARLLADDALNRVAHGGDPQRDKIAERRGTRFRDAVESFVRLHCERHNRESTAHETARVLRSRFVARWGSRDVREVGKGDIVALLDGIVNGGHPSAANHALAAIRKFFAWSVERGLVDTSPCAGIRAPAVQKSRDRVLEDRELAAVWRGCAQISYPFGIIVRLLILTAQRRGEVTTMCWSELDLDAATWSIPAAKTKSNRAQVVPVVPPAIVMLKATPRFGGDFVFPAVGNGERSFSGFSKAKRRLDEISGVHGWTLHDLRRTAATGLARLSVAPHVVEKILNHTTGTLGGVAGVYNRFGYLPEMRAALEQWAQHVAELAGDKA
jgi:integrase